MFGDDDLFDAWDDGDDLSAKVLLLLAIGRQLERQPDPERRIEAMRLLDKLHALADEFNDNLSIATRLIGAS